MNLFFELCLFMMILVDTFFMVVIALALVRIAKIKTSEFRMCMAEYIFNSFSRNDRDEEDDEDNFRFV